MLSCLTDEESSYLCEVLCTLLELGINVRGLGKVDEYYGALSELDEFLNTLEGDSLTEANHVLGAIFECPKIEGLFHQAAAPLLRRKSVLDFSDGLNNMYLLAEELLECILAGGNSVVFRMIKI